MIALYSDIERIESASLKQHDLPKNTYDALKRS